MRHRDSLIRDFRIIFISWIAAVHFFFAINGQWACASSTEAADISPTNTSISGGFSWSSGGPYGGYVYCLARAVSDAKILYVGTDDGVYVSLDAGMSWKHSGLS